MVAERGGLRFMDGKGFMAEISIGTFEPLMADENPAGTFSKASPGLLKHLDDETNAGIAGNDRCKLNYERQYMPVNIQTYVHKLINIQLIIIRR